MVLHLTTALCCLLSNGRGRTTHLQYSSRSPCIFLIKKEHILPNVHLKYTVLIYLSIA